MKKSKEEFIKDTGLIRCTCGYYNKDFNVKTYGTCTRCHKVLDSKAYFQYKMTLKLRVWRDKKWNY